MILPKPNRGATGPGASGHAVANPPQANPAGGRAGLFLTRIAVGLAALAAWAGPLRAATIAIPNASFESPATDYATPLVDSWQQVPQPDFANQATLQTGVFSNQPPIDPSHIDNCDGAQGLFLFATPQAAIFQDYDSTDYMSTTPTHAFNAKFNVNRAYSLTVGVIGGGGGMYDATPLELSLYYRDAASNRVTVAATTITNNAQLFPTNTHFVDFSVYVPGVRATDAWAGQNIGVQIASTVSANQATGYWDVDNVRLTETLLPTLTDPRMTNGHFSFTLQSQPGLGFEILATTNFSLPMSSWTNLATLTNFTGTVPFLDPATNLNRRFYQARQLQ